MSRNMTSDTNIRHHGRKCNVSTEFVGTCDSLNNLLLQADSKGKNKRADAGVRATSQPQSLIAPPTQACAVAKAEGTVSEATRKRFNVSWQCSLSAWYGGRNVLVLQQGQATSSSIRKAEHVEPTMLFCDSRKAPGVINCLALCKRSTQG